VIPAGLGPFFDAESVAVIGASRDPSKVGGSVLANLQSAGFAGRVIPVNRSAAHVQGLPARASVLDVDEPVDIAIIALPAPGVLPALRECVSMGIRGAIVISAGFRESGPDGREREAALRQWLAGQPIRVLGPNCLGWIRPSRRLNLTFAAGTPTPGNIAFVSHSGALAVAILDWARDRRMGFSLFASLGNQADVNESDVLEAVAADSETRVIVAYLEGLADGRRFLQALRAAAAAKPVVVLKSGRSTEGARAVSSHTGALAGSDLAFDAAVKQAGALRVSRVEELFDVARGLATQPLPAGRRLIVITNGGGLGIVSTDAARGAGLLVEPLPEASRRSLAAVLPPTASLGNPIDLVGDADAVRYSNALHGLGPGSGDAVLVVLTAQAATDAPGVARAIVGATRGWPIPVAAAFVGGARVAPGARALEDAGIPCYAFPEPAVEALAGMARLAERRAAKPVPTAFDVPLAEVRARVSALKESGIASLGLLELGPLLARYGIHCAMPLAVASVEEAEATAEVIGFPVALKIRSPDISHKSDVGGVALDLASGSDVARAARSMLHQVREACPRAALHGFTVQPMVGQGRELLMGMVRDPQFGPVVMVGAGGIYVEIIRDTSVRLAPVSIADAASMLDELTMAPWLRGARGERPVDLAALTDAIARFSQLAVDAPELREIEVNPLVAGPTGAVAVDARGALGE